MFGIGLPELILIMTVALIVVGPEKLPALTKTIARQMIELKRAANTLKESLHEDPRSATKSDDNLTQVVELSAESPQALPGDQWIHEHPPKAGEINHQEIIAELNLPTVNDGLPG